MTLRLKIKQILTTVAFQTGAASKGGTQVPTQHLKQKQKDHSRGAGPSSPGFLPGRVACHRSGPGNPPTEQQHTVIRDTDCDLWAGARVLPGAGN